MEKQTIHDWNDIKNDFQHKLVIGNGASIAVWDKFDYDSLYDEADNAGIFSQRLKTLFQEYKTRDFELILKQLLQASIINKLLDINEVRTLELYKILRDALINTVLSMHPEQRDIESHLNNIAFFMRQFETIISLNYDLILYWAMLRGNKLFGQQFKDGFVNDNNTFRSDYETLYPPFGAAEATTMVFYPHGNLLLATIIDIDRFGTEIKLCRSDEKAMLLHGIIDEWKKGNVVPLFVSEGNTDTKLKAIKRSNYLQIAYSELEACCETVVLYGLSLNDDEHILQAVIKSEPAKIAISVHTNSGDIDAKCNEMQYKVKKTCIQINRELNKHISPNIIFFNANSSGCWKN